MQRHAHLLRARCRRARAGGVAVLLAVLLTSALAAPAGAVDGAPAEGADGASVGAPADGAPAGAAADRAPAGDPHAEQEAARRLVDTLAGELDRAAAAFEEAQAQHLHLGAERAEAQDAAVAAEERVAVARAAFAARAVDAYRRPSAELALQEVVLESRDSATAFHRVALIEVVRRHDDQVRRAEAADARADEQLRQHQILDAGMASSTEELQRRADALVAAGEEARSRAADAEAAVRELEERRRAATEAARAAQAARDARAQQGAQDAQAAGDARAARSPQAAAALPPGAMACPVGLPHGFIDSWGFPRSGGRSHKGVDIFAARGTPLYAVADGTVQRVGSDRLGGLVVHLLDDSGHRYYYAHLDSFAVTAGQRVRAGDVLGAVGNTGNARTTPPHLHWQYHPHNGPPVNPYPLARAVCRG